MPPLADPMNGPSSWTQEALVGEEALGSLEPCFLTWLDSPLGSYLGCSFVDSSWLCLLFLDASPKMSRLKPRRSEKIRKPCGDLWGSAEVSKREAV
ncbi:hypothetical protein VULLAG_LOCUS882 [Vulpes lagopus]